MDVPMVVIVVEVDSESRREWMKRVYVPTYISNQERQALVEEELGCNGEGAYRFSLYDHSAEWLIDEWEVA